MRRVLFLIALSLAGLGSVFATGMVEVQSDAAPITLTLVGRYETGIFDEGAAEIVDYDPGTQNLFIVNANDGSVDIIGIATPSRPRLVSRIPVTTGTANSLAVHNGIVAVAVEAEDSQAPGMVVFGSTDGELLASVQVGSLPDMVVFSPDGRYVLSANEGEPNDDYSIDPVGSVSIIDVSGGVENLSSRNVRTVTFENAPRIGSIRANGPGASFAQDMEPEYIVVDAMSRYAYVALQEANAIAKIDIRTGSTVFVKSLGLKDHSIAGNGMDASDRDGRISITAWPVFGLYMPDGLASYSVGGETYIISANEGDGRDYDTFSDETDGDELALDPAVFSNASSLQDDARLGRLLVSATDGDVDGDGLVEMIVSMGARSMSIWDSSINLVADTGDEFERVIAERYPEYFNIGGDALVADNRSDNKGPEPEGVVVGPVNGRHYAFVGLERQSAIMVYDVEDPRHPRFVDVVTSLNFEAPVDDEGEFLDTDQAGDIAPEGLKFIPASQSPNGRPLLVVANEVSGTVSIWQVE